MNDGLCYRLYTKGSCDDGQVVSDTKTCIKNPCQKNFLFFPHEQTCYRIGSQGPCRPDQVVVFDFTVKVGLDGISYNGMCGCSGIIKNLDQSCLKDDDSPKTLCDSPLVEFKGGCYSLYSKGNLIEESSEIFNNLCKFLCFFKVPVKPVNGLNQTNSTTVQSPLNVNASRVTCLMTKWKLTSASAAATVHQFY